MADKYLIIYLSDGRTYETTRSLENVRTLTLWRKEMLMKTNHKVFPIYDELLDAINNGNYKIVSYNTRKRK